MVYLNSYEYLYSMGNLTLAWRNARKGKTRKEEVVGFERGVVRNLLALHYELKNKIYSPKPLTAFVLRDPKTRVISKSDFRDRIVHHAIVLAIGLVFEKQFIYDSCANQLNKGSLFALRRFDKYSRKVSRNYSSCAFCLKADIKHYFQEVSHKILVSILNRKIIDKEIIGLIEKILANNVSHKLGGESPKGIPLGNLTSQFFANVYLNELDYFVKHKIKAKYYIRYVDDFVILHSSKKQLEIWKEQIDRFLREKLNLELHPQKSKISPLSKGVDFVGFRNFRYFKLLRKRNIKKIFAKISSYKRGEIPREKILRIFQGWQAYAKWANTFKLRKNIVSRIYASHNIV